MIVVADASPLRYLILIHQIQILPVLYGRIVAPLAVQRELTHSRTPDLVCRWMESPPSWCEVRSPALPLPTFPPELGLGEREAISIARELKADALLADDFAARITAEKHGIETLGTLSTLDRAAEQGFVAMADALKMLMATNFRANADLVRFYLERDRLRHGGAPQ